MDREKKYVLHTGYYELVRKLCDPWIISIPNKGVRRRYLEAYLAFVGHSWSGTVLACRTLLMFVAESKGASHDWSFAQCIDWLDKNNYFPTDAKNWIDNIREIGNKANHTIDDITAEDAHKLIYLTNIFIRQLCEISYILEFDPEKTVEISRHPIVHYGETPAQELLRALELDLELNNALGRTDEARLEHGAPSVEDWQGYLRREAMDKADGKQG